jgi:alpha-ribazole phosphatase
MKLILIRHGESTWNKSKRVQGTKNPHLSDKGIKQSQLLADRFNGIRFDAVYSSPLTRAYETAKILTNSKYNIHTLQDLQEIKLGVWEGKTINQVSKEYKKEYNKWYKKPMEVKIPGAETILEFKDRVVKTLDKIRAQHPNQDVLVVTHGGVITIYLAHLLEMNLNKVWSISLKNGSVTILSFYERFPCVLLFNDTCHLDFDKELITW